MIHYLVTTVKIYKTLTKSSWKDATRKEKLNLIRVCYQSDGTRFDFSDLLTSL